MATDRYSDNHTISVSGGSGTLTVDGSLNVTGGSGVINASGITTMDINATGTVTLSGDITVSTPGGDIDFSSSMFEIKKPIPMFFLNWLDSNGYSSAAIPPLFQPQINVGNTTSNSFTFNTPGLLFQSSGDSIEIPIHEFLRKGSTIRLSIVCEMETPVTLSSNPFDLTCKKVYKEGSSTSHYYNAVQSTLETISFVNDTRKLISTVFSVSFDSSQDFVFLDIQRTAATGGDLVVYSIEVSTLGNFYDIIGLT
jgi:hypothetical protein